MKRWGILLLTIAMLVCSMGIALGSQNDMIVVNCDEWVSLRSAPDKDSSRLAKVPLGARVSGCMWANSQYMQCTYGGMTGYILAEYLTPAAHDGYIGEMTVVNCDEWVSLRSAPDKDSSRLAKVPLGARVYNCAWYTADYIQCSYNGQTGYILGQYLSATAQPVQLGGSVIPAMVVVNCDEWVSLRSAPDTGSSRLASVVKGTLVSCCQQYNSQFTRCVFNGRAGYILSEYLAIPTAANSADYVGSMTVVNCNEWVSLRAEPDTDSARILKIPLGAVVSDCIWYSSEFIYGTYNGQSGFIVSRYLSEQAWGSEPAGVSVGAMTVANCESWVSLRAQPSTSAPRMAQVPLGATVVNCYRRDDGFTYCEYNGMTGYILSEYLRSGSGESGFQAAPALSARDEFCIWGAEAMNVQMEDGRIVLARRSYEGEGEQLRVGCFDAQGNRIWQTYTATTYRTELTMTAAFVAGTKELPMVMMYNAEKGLTALDLTDGTELWFLPESEVNLGASIAYAVDEAGTMYIGGFYGPDPVSISPDGRVLWQSKAGVDAYWMTSIEVWNDAVVVYYDCVKEHEAMGRVCFDLYGNMLWWENL